jgi:hypothetical protein
VVLVVQPALASFVVHNFGQIATVKSGHCDWPPRCDRYVWTMSLPGFAGCLPSYQPLSAPLPLVCSPGRGQRLRVGICWAGNPKYARDKERSIPLAAFDELLLEHDIEWYSLYVGERTSEAVCYPELRSPNPELLSFAETANLIMGLDCVVTVDTAVGHLAGVLGVPTYLLLPYASSWRWGTEPTSPWYPSTRLMRQPLPDDWTSVVRDLTAELRRLLGR